MELDPSESINNMGKLRVDVLDAVDLPSADRNGYSDPYCKFELNGEMVFKTKTQKKTLHPAWNEFFDVDISSRTAAEFVCTVYDWDFGDKADLLGTAHINLELLDPFKPQEYNLKLDGKSGTVRLRLLFRPDYVTRTHQRTSTFSGTFAAPGKIVTGVASAPIKGVGLAAHGVGKGASFLRNGFRGKKTDEIRGDSISTVDSSTVVPVNGNDGGAPVPSLLVPPSGNTATPPTESPVTPPGTAQASSPHGRTKSFGASSIHSTFAGGAPTGTATFTIVSTSGYPPSSNIMVYVKHLGPKPKVLHKTAHIKSSTGTVQFDAKKETFKCSCTADSQFQVQVKGHSTFGSDDDLGEGFFVVDESGSNLEKRIPAGSGEVVIKSNFMPAAENGTESPKSSIRRSLLSKRENGRASREVTPNP